MKKRKDFYFPLGIGIACLVVGAGQIYRGLAPLDYLPIIVIGFCVIAAGYGNGSRKNSEAK